MSYLIQRFCPLAGALMGRQLWCLVSNCRSDFDDLVVMVTVFTVCLEPLKAELLYLVPSSRTGLCGQVVTITC